MITILNPTNVRSKIINIIQYYIIAKIETFKKYDIKLIFSVFIFIKPKNEYKNRPVKNCNYNQIMHKITFLIIYNNIL